MSSTATAIRDEGLDRELLALLHDYVREHAEEAVRRFASALGEEFPVWKPVRSTRLPACTHLESLATQHPGTREHRVLAGFAGQIERLHWEQSYKASDGLVGAAMLADYGFAEIAGARGPCVSDTVRSGIGVWGPGILYPRHWHKAREVYAVLAGVAEFEVDDAGYRRFGPGEAVVVESNQPHSLQTHDEPVIVLYVWQQGEMRQVSSFG